MQSAHAPQRSISPAGAAVLAYVDAGDFDEMGRQGFPLEDAVSSRCALPSLSTA